MADRSSTALAAAGFAVALTLSAVNIVHQLDVAGSPFRGGAALSDFRDTFYFPGVALLEGHNPYASIDYLDRYPVAHAYPLYSPAALLLHLPFSLLPYRTAQLLFVAANVVALLLFALAALRLAGIKDTAAAVLAVATLILLSRPGQQNLFLGQCTFYVAGGAYLALLCAKTRPWLAGLGVALACIKPTTGVPLAILMLFRGESRAVVAGIALSAVAVLRMVVPLMHISDLAGWISALQDNLAVFRGNRAVNPITSSDRSDLAAFLSRLIDRPLTAVESIAFAALLLGATGIVIRRLQRVPMTTGTQSSPRTANTQPNEIMASALVCLTIFVGLYHLPYDALLLTAPAIALIANRAALAEVGIDRRRWRLALAMLAVPAFNYLASERGLELVGGIGWWFLTSATSIAGGVLYFSFLRAAWHYVRPPLRFPRPRRLEATGPIDWISSYDHFGPGLLLRRRLNWVSESLPVRMQRVLEIGFGSGVFQYELAYRAGLSVGLDVHPNAARVGQRLGEDGVRAALLQGDGAVLPFRSGSFDAVVILSSLEFVADPAACLRECRRVLRPGGRLICVRPRQLPWIDLGFRLLLGADPESEFAGGRARVEAAIKEALDGARRLLKPLGWTRWLAPYEVVVFDRTGPGPTHALAVDAAIVE